MINFAKVRADIAAAPGDYIAMAKEQLDELVSLAESGAQAKRALSSIRAQAVFAASACGAPA